MLPSILIFLLASLTLFLLHTPFAPSKVDAAEEETAGGVLLTDDGQEKPTTGVVMAIGPGKVNEETGEVSEMKLKVGDKVSFFKWAGDAVDTPAGDTFNIVNESDVLCKL